MRSVFFASFALAAASASALQLPYRHNRVLKHAAGKHNAFAQQEQQAAAAVGRGSTALTALPSPAMEPLMKLRGGASDLNLARETFLDALGTFSLLIAVRLSAKVPHVDRSILY